GLLAAFDPAVPPPPVSSPLPANSPSRESTLPPLPKARPRPGPTGSNPARPRAAPESAAPAETTALGSPVTPAPLSPAPVAGGADSARARRPAGVSPAANALLPTAAGRPRRSGARAHSARRRRTR